MWPAGRSLPTPGLECAPPLGDHTSQPRRENSVQGVGEVAPTDCRPRIQEQYGFLQGCRTVDQIFTFAELLRGHGSLMCFVDLEKAIDHIPQGILWGYCAGIDGLPHGQSGRVPRAPEPIGALGLQSFCFCFFGTI